MTINHQEWNPQTLLETGRAFWETRLLLTAVELDLFTLLKKSLTVDEVAQAKRSHPRAEAREVKSTQYPGGKPET